MSSKERLIQAHILKELSEQIIMLENSAKANSDLMQELFDTNEDLTGRISEANRELKKKDAVIEGLKGELDDEKERHRFHVSIINDVHAMLDEKGYTKGLLTNQVSDLFSIVTSSEAEANSYRELYNELRTALDAHESQSPANILLKVERMQKKVKHQEKIIELARESDANLYRWGHDFELKHRRLIAFMKKASNTKSKSVLKIHRANEKKLKEKRDKS